MSDNQVSELTPIKHPPGYRNRRGLNWAFLGLLYTSFYMCRYNLPIATSSICKEFNYSNTDFGKIITLFFLVYACGQVINGLITDKIGGKRAMLIGAAGTITMNILFGLASYTATFHAEMVDALHPTGSWLAQFNLFHISISLNLLTLFIAIRGVDGYVQSFGAPGMIKINTAWFPRRERGRFAGIFGFMINLGRFGINKLGPSLLAGFTFLGMLQVPPLHWRWLFFIPSCICAVVAIGMALTVKETPEQAGFPTPQDDGVVVDPNEPAPSFGGLIIKMLSHPTIWIVALAYACTGAVRQSVDQWFAKWMEDRFQVNIKSDQFAFLGFMIPFVASAGSLMSGYVSDIFFQGRRAPVAAFLYFLETAIILAAAKSTSANAAMVFLILISLTANSTHSILGTAAAMDIGGRKQAGFASGIIDSFQYLGASLSGVLLGTLLDKNLGNYFYFMAPFGFIGGLLMLVMMRVASGRPKGSVTS